MPCVLNAANEVVVELFLHRKIKFLQIPDIIEFCLAKVQKIAHPSLDDLLATDKLARQLASSAI
jgi:1-deoxy-D-xylulose-5-phosphate reductoisomerase